ncbi:PadR family transcriptional regulator [Pseudactinotalea sp. HY158]|uniref:PadR family transcriptional regulator n=1 Tax=Pseudactinotalea sp. HY158 TaxID=2654547 RepID=UPI00129C367C|nr:helix-turn-helix transcriptional regulator [Pseudactinotalea sp. HY158]QGH70051.1 PadR family transcriptional regulator [Pseudactinotalea sp. HY158]
MSVKQGILALLSVQPMGVARLRREFEARTGGTWPLNIGQVYTTAQRLERDGLITRVAAEPPGGADAGPAADTGAAPATGANTGHGAPGEPEVEQYTLTRAGRSAAAEWWHTPVNRGTPERDELVIKISLAVTMPGVDVREVVQRQRSETMRALRDLTRLVARTDPDSDPDLAWSLVLDHHVFTAEAELRWLDHIESRAERAASRPRVVHTPAPKATNTPDRKATNR